MAQSERSFVPTVSARRGIRWVAAGAVVAVLATVGMTTWAQGHGGPGMGGPGMLFAGPPEHVDRAVDHLLDGLQATDAQRSQIKQIAEAAAADLKVQHAADKALHQQSMQVFSAAVVDANAAESLRQQMLVQHDQATRRTLQAMLDVSNVLTPDQRAKIAARMQQREAHMQEHMQRMQGDRPQS